MKLENEIEQLMIIEAAKFGVHLWRNNSGALKDVEGRLVRFGLANDSNVRNEVLKSSDRIGIVPITITPEMIGRKIGVFVAVEMKREDWKYTGKPDEIAQKAFIDTVLNNGGFAGFCNDRDSLMKILRGER